MLACVENRFEFPFKLIGEANYVWRVYSNPGSTAGGPERGFRPCFSDILSQKFSSVCGKARHVQVNEYFNHQ